MQVLVVDSMAVVAEPVEVEALLAVEVARLVFWLPSH